MIELAKRLLRRHEGYRQHPYHCPANRLSVGFGRNLDDVGISVDEADYLLGNDIGRAIEGLRMEPYWLDLDEARQAVLIDMSVNLGFAGFKKFVKLREALYRRDYAEAARQMVQSRWYGQVGRRGPLLVDIMSTGQAPAWLEEDEA